ncbi:flagellar export chaperone FlgN [Eleftheria terrae]|uniref:flagellar export chaperone FlgN n=1 Tax=Eleftheria terrae TaxID=1597781 RepID=UPI00263B76E8|nr:flagellar export chaperone FlgN [Eleftheria terrae]WKB54102.1 flagellar protein FlgN [Eleftheria terrae]
MTETTPLARLLQGVRADLTDYVRLQELLESQFEAALRHETVAMQDVAERITALAAMLEARRQDRVALLEQLLAGQAQPASIDALLPQLSPQGRATLQAWWRTLEERVRHCKALNARNCRLLMDQHEIMQRVLQPEADLYAPA